jgi:DNA polymerase III epsilon subunit-like protein
MSYTTSKDLLICEANDDLQRKLTIDVSKRIEKKLRTKKISKAKKAPNVGQPSKKFKELSEDSSPEELSFARKASFNQSTESTKQIKTRRGDKKKETIKSTPDTKFSLVSSDLIDTKQLIHDLFETHDKLKVGDTNIPNDPILQVYARIVDFNENQLRNKLSTFTKIISSKPHLHSSLIEYLTKSTDRVSYLRHYSDEQLKYITNESTKGTKLIACPGSGKTRSIIARIKFSVEHSLVLKDENYVATFSRAAATDFLNRITQLFPTFESFLSTTNISTLDSLAKSVLCSIKSHKSENVELLSIAFRNYLKEAKPEELKSIKKLNKIKYLFIDEAQDLNEIQHDIICSLSEKLGVQINLVGDPNQNIFQFRRSSDQYLLNFPGERFFLTINYRSTQQIINFFQDLRPLDMGKIKSGRAKNINGGSSNASVNVPSNASSKEQSNDASNALSKDQSNDTSNDLSNDLLNAVVVIHEDEKFIHKFILEFIKNYSKDKSNIAIICPSRGVGSVTNVGLSYLSNMFSINGVRFNQLYEESRASDDKSKKKMRIVQNEVNLLTYHGTKGLEFDVVFVMDFFQDLFNIKPSETEHVIHRYLLYVACSRAKNKLFVCTYKPNSINHWLSYVNPRNYFPISTIKFDKLTFRSEDKKNMITSIVELLVQIDEKDLNEFDDHLIKKHEFSELIWIEEGESVDTKNNIGDTNSKTVPKPKSKLKQKTWDLGKDDVLMCALCKNLFYLTYQFHAYTEQAKNGIWRGVPRFNLIESLLNSTFITIDNEEDYIKIKAFIAQNQLTWQKFDVMKFMIPFDVVKLIEKYFSRNTELEAYVLCNGYYLNTIKSNIQSIKKAYEHYLHPEHYSHDYKNIMSELLYLTTVEYAIETNHYYHMESEAHAKKYLIESDQAKTLFEHINFFALDEYLAYQINPKVKITFDKLVLCGMIDYLAKPRSRNQNYLSSSSASNHTQNSQIICEIKFCKDFNIRHYLQLILYNFCYNYQWNSKYKLTNTQNLYNAYVRIINFYTGMQYYLFLEFKPESMFKLLNKMATIGGLKFSGMNIIYDLETTGLIEMVSVSPNKPQCDPLNHMHLEYSSHVYKLYKYPEIIEIAMKEYDTGLIVFNDLIKPKSFIEKRITEITGITNNMVLTKKSIGIAKLILNGIFNNFVSNKTSMIAHNGSMFDDKIIKKYALVSETQANEINWIDTRNFIPLHLKTGVKLEEKSLEEVFKRLFPGIKYDAHRAMGDVNALIIIMQELRIKF